MADIDHWTTPREPRPCHDLEASNQSSLHAGAIYAPSVSTSGCWPRSWPPLAAIQPRRNSLGWCSRYANRSPVATTGSVTMVATAQLGLRDKSWKWVPGPLLA